MPEIMESSKIKVLTRATFDAITKESNVVYFVLEGTSEPFQCVSLYIGDAPQTDIVSIDDLLMDANNFNSQNANDVPVSLITVNNKLYYWKDTALDVYRAYVKDNVGVFPLYGTSVWESIET